MLLNQGWPRRIEKRNGLFKLSSRSRISLLVGSEKALTMNNDNPTQDISLVACR